MNTTDDNDVRNPEPTPSVHSKLLSFALFHCDPQREPPFALELGFSDATTQQVTDCANIPDALLKLEDFCQNANLAKSNHFTLLYPIYLEAMDTDDESTMHSVAWMIKEQADQHKWNFERIGGYTDKKAADYFS